MTTVVQALADLVYENKQLKQLIQELQEESSLLITQKRTLEQEVRELATRIGILVKHLTDKD